nr:MAG TPA: hypothetical protein [Caudoviricetes sp.]
MGCESPPCYEPHTDWFLVVGIFYAQVVITQEVNNGRRSYRHRDH